MPSFGHFCSGLWSLGTVASAGNLSGDVDKGNIVDE